MFSLDGLKLRDIDKGLTGRKHSFALFHVSGKNVFRDMKQVSDAPVMGTISDTYDDHVCTDRFHRRESGRC